MNEQYQEVMLVADYLDSLDIHPITVTEAISDENYMRTYQILRENPQITKREFLEKMQLEEWED